MASANPELWCPDLPSPRSCGLRTLERSVGLYLGIQIQYVATVDLAGFGELIDALGGVNLCLPGKLVDPGYTGPGSAKRGVELPAGCHAYNGYDALAYARIRKGWIEMPDGTVEYQNDFKRADRQQKVLLALRTELAAANLVFELPGILDAIGRTREQRLPARAGRQPRQPAAAHHRPEHRPARARLSGLCRPPPGPEHELPPHPEARRDPAAMTKLFGATAVEGWYLGSDADGPPPGTARAGAAGGMTRPVPARPDARDVRGRVRQSGPEVRIRRMLAALREQVAVDLVDGHRPGRRAALAGYALRGRLRGLDGIYVESSTALPSETDLAILGVARAAGIPVLTYVRDAYQLFEDYYQADTWRRRASRRLFPAAMRALRLVSTDLAFPSRGLAEAVLGPRAGAEAPLLPPGSPPPFGVPRAPGANRLLFVGDTRVPAQGGDLMLAAVEAARRDGVDVELLCVTRPGGEPPLPHPAWLRVERASSDEVAFLLPEVIGTVIPRAPGAYNDLAIPIKLMEYLAYGRPLLVTDRPRRRASCAPPMPASWSETRLTTWQRRSSQLVAASPEQRDAWDAARRRRRDATHGRCGRMTCWRRSASPVPTMRPLRTRDLEVR